MSIRNLNRHCDNRLMKVFDKVPHKQISTGTCNIKSPIPVYIKRVPFYTLYTHHYYKCPCKFHTKCHIMEFVENPSEG